MQLHLHRAFKCRLYQNVTDWSANTRIFTLFFLHRHFHTPIICSGNVRWQKSTEPMRKKHCYDHNVDALWIICRISTFFEILFIIIFFPMVWSDALSLFDAIFGFIPGMRRSFCHVNCIAVDILWAGISRMNNWSEMKKCMWVWIFFPLLPKETETHTQCWIVCGINTNIKPLHPNMAKKALTVKPYSCWLSLHC